MSFSANGIERPKYLCREKKEDVKVEKPKKKRLKRSFKRKPINQLGLLP